MQTTSWSQFSLFNAFTAPACKLSGLKNAHIIYIRLQTVMRWSYNESIFTIVQFDRNPSPCLCEGEEDLNDFIFDTCIGRFEAWQ